MAEPLTICVVSHEGYIGNVNLILKMWDSFAPEEWGRIISLDGCQFDNSNFPKWEVIENAKSGSPIIARNSALNRLTKGYVLFWDADNIPTKEYVESIKNVLELESDIFCWYPDMYLPYEPFDIRTTNYIDTASVIRVESLKAIGGWKDNQPCLQDWELYLRALSHGFKFEPLNSRFVYCKHSESLTFSAAPTKELPKLKSIGIICPMRGDISLSKTWLDSLCYHDMPSKTGVTIVDKSGDESFGRWLKIQMVNLPFDRVTYIKDEKVPDPNNFFSVHNSVGKSYALALKATPEDLILTWEDDVIPHSREALKSLSSKIYPLSQFHVMGAHVPSRENSDRLIASENKEKWSGFIPENIPNMREIGMVGGGFTLWYRVVLEEFGFQGYRYLDNFPAGWDGWLCRRINSKYKIGLFPEKCHHESARSERK